MRFPWHHQKTCVCDVHVRARSHHFHELVLRHVQAGIRVRRQVARGDEVDRSEIEAAPTREKAVVAESVAVGALTDRIDQIAAEADLLDLLASQAFEGERNRGYLQTLRRARLYETLATFGQAIAELPHRLAKCATLIATDSAEPQGKNHRGTDTVDNDFH